jgi:hypothetical protein
MQMQMKRRTLGHSGPSAQYSEQLIFLQKPFILFSTKKYIAVLS